MGDEVDDGVASVFVVVSWYVGIAVDAAVAGVVFDDPVDLCGEVVTVGDYPSVPVWVYGADAGAALFGSFADWVGVGHDLVVGVDVLGVAGDLCDAVFGVVGRYGPVTAVDAGFVDFVVAGSDSESALWFDDGGEEAFVSSWVSDVVVFGADAGCFFFAVFSDSDRDFDVACGGEVGSDGYSVGVGVACPGLVFDADVFGTRVGL